MNLRFATLFAGFAIVSGALVLHRQAASQTSRKLVLKNAVLTAKTIEVDLLHDTLAARGNCKLQDDPKHPSTIVTCDRIDGQLKKNQFAEFVANGNVVLHYRSVDNTGATRPIEGSCDKAVWQSGANQPAGKGELVLTGNARLNIEGGEEPIKLSATKIVIDPSSNSFTATGDCRVVTKTAEMTGDQMVGAVEDEGKNELTTTGNVKATTTYVDQKSGSRKQVFATGKRSVYRAGQQQLVITGDATLQVSDVNEKVKGAEIMGEKITINLKEQKILIDTEDVNKPTTLKIEGRQEEERK